MIRLRRASAPAVPGVQISNLQPDLPETTTDHAGPPEEPTAWGPAAAPGSADHFRPDIEGLRAVAVIAVLLYHARVPFMTGGFIGVDVFYVISGFLITGLLLREYEHSGGIDLTRFYARRARRLLPAALAVIVATLALSALALSVIQLRTVAADAAAAALYVSNYRFALTATDYLAAHEPSPLLHFWSLGVEEQFYLFWPLVVLLVSRLLGVRRLWWVVATIAVASFSLSVWLTSAAQPWAFFSLPTRAWELALGALAAVGLIAVPRRWPRLAASLVGLAGLAVIAFSSVAIRPDTPFPGIVAVLPALGALLVIVAGERSGALGGRLLAVAPARWIGRISYSLYLWHWPILVLVPPLLARDDLATRLVLAAACLVIAELSTRFVETPFRFGRVARFAAPRVVAVALGTSMVVALGSLTAGELGVLRLRSAVVEPPSPPPSVAAETPTPTAIATAMSSPGPTPRSSASPPSSLLPATPEPDPTPTSEPSPALPPALIAGQLPRDLRPTLLDADADVARSLRDGCQASVNQVQPPPCVYGVTESSTTVVLIGDSHAAQWLPAIEVLAAERSWRIEVVTKASCPPVDVLVWLENYSRPYGECLEWQTAALARIDDVRPAIAFVSFSRGYQVVDRDRLSPITDNATLWESATEALLERVETASGRTVYIADTPRHDSNPVHCLASHLRIEACPSRRADRLNHEYAAIEEAAAAAAAGTDFLRPADWLCDASVCPLVFGNYLVYRDITHLTATFAGALGPRIGWWLEH